MNVSRMHTPPVVPFWARPYELAGRFFRMPSAPLDLAAIRQRNETSAEQVRCEEENVKELAIMGIVVIVCFSVVAVYTLLRICWKKLRPHYWDYPYLMSKEFPGIFLATKYEEFSVAKNKRKSVSDFDATPREGLIQVTEQKQRRKEEKERKKRERWERKFERSRDVESDMFVAPGNIYRLLAVLHPGLAPDIQTWISWAT